MSDAGFYVTTPTFRFHQRTSMGEIRPLEDGGLRKAGPKAADLGKAFKPRGYTLSVEELTPTAAIG